MRNQWGELAESLVILLKQWKGCVVLTQPLTLVFLHPRESEMFNLWDKMTYKTLFFSSRIALKITTKYRADRK